MSEDVDSISRDNLNDLMPLMENGRVIPVISNSFRIEEIFRSDEELLALMADVPQFYDELRTFHQQLTRRWAEEIKYPMSDDHNLARVAQYRQVEKGTEEARRQYLKFLIERLLKINENDEKFKDTVAGLRKLSKIPSFTYVADKLRYPRFFEGAEDPLSLLAKLPVKIYLTTSYSTFLEDALRLMGKKPRTQLCFCTAGKLTIDANFLPDRDFRPDRDNPAVVHLYGLENYTNTLVLSEDDHINFLLNAVEELNSPDVYPSYLRGALPESSLLLLGYHLRDWDFRTLFRFISKIRKMESADMDGDMTPSIAIQFNPKLKNDDNKARSIEYLSNYFKKRNFTVRWAGSEQFIYELWATWEKYQEDPE